MDAVLAPWFDQFLDLRTNRFELLRTLLSARGLAPSVVALAGSRHLLVAPSRTRADYGTPTVLLAHYDRVPTSPGANDNAAAVFILVESALRLRAARQEGWLLIFTDKEEAAVVNGVHGQGSFGLSKALKGTGLGEARYYIFDACGRGDTLIVSTALDHLLRGQAGAGIENTRRSIAALREHALGTARQIRAPRVLLAPTPFSDDAGLLAGGIGAQTITVLPYAEASVLVHALRRHPAAAASLVNRDAPTPLKAPPFVPATWKLLNGSDDGPATLTPEINPLMVRFACALCDPRNDHR